VVSTSLSNGQSLYLQASYVDGTLQLLALGYADVPPGTSGTLDVSGPVSWECVGVFTAHPADHDPGVQAWQNLPEFTVGGYSEQGFYAPTGDYVFRLMLTSPKGSAEASVHSDGEAQAAAALQSGCVQS
jgi:hypothetical protein